jgi:hypothetical protein
MSRFLTELRPSSAPITTVRTNFYKENFYKEEFIKHRECLQKQREYFSDAAIDDVEAALVRIIGELEQLCRKDDVDQVVSSLLRKFDVVTQLSTWTDPKQVH